MYKLAQWLLAVGTGLFLLSLGLALFTGVLIVATPQDTTVGKAVLNALTSGEVQPAGSEFLDGAPNVWDELKAMEDGTKHPVLVDLSGRMDTKWSKPAQFVDGFQYRNFLFFDFFAEDGHYWLYVYRWDGAQWKFVDEVCQDCEQ